MDFPAPSPVHYGDETPERSWKRTAIVTAAIAGIELVVLLVIMLAFIAKPFAGDASSKPQASTNATEAAVLSPRAETPVLVLNGNGVAGAAGAAAKQVRKLAYPVVGVDDASRQNVRRTVVMYRDGSKNAALRLVHDLGLPARRAIPLDGVRPKELQGAELALVLGQG